MPDFSMSEGHFSHWIFAILSGIRQAIRKWLRNFSAGVKCQCQINPVNAKVNFLPKSTIRIKQINYDSCNMKTREKPSEHAF